MTAPLERTKSMRAYADAYGEPDREVSDRLEQRLESMIEQEESGGAPRRWWIPALAGLLVVGALGLAAGLWMGDAGRDGIVRTGDAAQRIRVSAGTVLLRPGTDLKVIHDEGRSIVELRGGGIEVEGNSDALEVLSGQYSIQGTGARFSVVHTAGVPIVTVEEGVAVVRGPNLPPGGVSVLPVSP